MDQLLQLEITHSYYRDLRLRGMTIKPAPATAALLKSWGLLCRQLDNSLVIMCDTESVNGEKVPSFMPVNGVKLAFLLSTSSSYFINISDVPLDVGGKALYFSNHSSNEEEDSLLLHEGSNAGAAPLLTLQSLVFTLPVPVNGAERVVTITGMDGETAVKMDVDKDSGSCTIDLSGHGEGAYTIRVDEAKVLECYAIEGWVSGLGIIEIFLDSKVPENYRILKPGNTLAKPSYRISFESRSTTWAYLVQGKFPPDYRDMAVENAKSSAAFSQPEKVSLLNGSTALAFYSTKPLPLSERPSQYFQLKNTHTVLVKALPAPGPEMITPTGKGQIRSEIFVYL